MIPCCAPCSCAPCCDRFVGCFVRHTYYLIDAPSYVKTLETKRNILVARKADLNTKIQHAERESKVPSQEMDLWKKQVDDMLGTINEVVNAYDTGSCLCAICSDYKTSYRCDEMTKEVDRLLNEGFNLLEKEMMVCYSKAPIDESYVVPGSLDSECKEVLEYIEDGNSEGNVLGIWGMGGVGKTTLLKKIHNSCIGLPIFSHVIWIGAIEASGEQSKTFKIQSEIAKKLNIFRIQSEIAKKLKLKLDEDGIQSNATSISNFLRDKNFLLFIDDLWEDVDLHKAGVPISYEAKSGKNSKVVFTTRFNDICGKMAKKKIKVNPLDPEKSWLLFEENVGKQVIRSHSRIPQLAKDVAKECKGLPLALITIGCAMSTNSNDGDWKDALGRLKISQGHDTLRMEEKLLNVLEISYYLLPTKVLRDCFLIISLWPKDFRISKDELIACWLGLDIINNFENIQEAYQTGRSLIGQLLSASLLEYGENTYLSDGPYTGVKMHNILRELALWIASDHGKKKNKWLVKAGIKLQEAPRIEMKWSEAEYISLMHNGLKELPSSIPSCPHLLTFVLQGNQLSCESILSSFHKFQSLRYLDLSENGLHSFPESICDLLVLQYLNLSSNKIKDIPEKLGNLKELKYLILRYNSIRNVPTEVFSKLVKLLVLDLFSPDHSKYSLVNVEELKWLEKKLLYLGISVWGDEVFNKLSKMPDLYIVALSISDLHIKSFNFMSMIPKLYCLEELFIGNSGDDLLEIIFEKIDNHQDLPSEINLENLRLFSLEKLNGIKWKGIEPTKLFGELQKIEIDSCNLDDIRWVIFLPSLKDLYIARCNKMRIAINNEDNENNISEVERNILTFPSLKSLSFKEMTYLEKISTHPLAFPELRTLYVSDCALLKKLPFEIEPTPKLVGIEGSKDWWDKLEWTDNSSKSHFSQLLREV